ncbi:MarR family transcriptional regulator [Streptomyces sp. NPDC000594]|uniref:GbsR/MarR family transcriptional regulator n=1 Tax=Streptomyces sp. NPDC000594 TaxID=3154261 RepID=UPI0033214CD5
MPGGRLTQEERSSIGGWLGEGIGYAEIARRLGRPTSTVSREVARNGGPGGYRPEHAHLATAGRARRRRPAAPPAPAPATDPYGRDTVAVREFVEEFAALMARSGMPPMATRVLTRLFATDSASLTAAGLVAELGVSPASVSQAIGVLEELDLVRRERVPGQRRERYTVGDDVWLRAWLASARKNVRWARTAARGVALLGPGTPAGDRMELMREFFARLGDDMAGGLSPATGEPTATGESAPAGGEAPAGDGTAPGSGTAAPGSTATWEETAADAVTVVAALAQSGAALTTGELAEALGWPPHRVAGALARATRRPHLGGPVALRRTPSERWTTAAAPGLLTPGQRRALTRPPEAGEHAPAR